MIMKINTRKIFIIILSMTFFSCQPDDKNKENVVAQVNDAFVTLEELQNQVPADTEEGLRSALLRQFMEEWVEEEVFYQTAINEHIELTESELRLVTDYKKRLIIQSYIENKINKPYRILDKEIEEYFQNHKDEFVWNDDHAHIIHLVVENNDSKLFSEIRQSNDLLEIIKSYFLEMRSTSTQPIGDLGYVRVSDLDDNISKKIKSLKTGEISRPITISGKYHFVQLLDYQKSGAFKDLELVKEDIILRLKIAHRKNELTNLKKELLTNFKIEKNISKLKTY